MWVTMEDCDVMVGLGWVAQEACGLATMGHDGRLVATEGHEEAGQWRSRRRLRWELGDGGRVGGWSRWRVAAGLAMLGCNGGRVTVAAAAVAVAEAVAAAAGMHEWGGHDRGSLQVQATKVM